MYLDKLPGLKKKLLEATVFSEVYEHFTEELGSDLAFARSGVPTDDKRILTSLGQVVARVTGEGGLLVGTVCRIASHRFLHGSFSYGKKWSLIMFYFEDVEQGFLAVGDHGGPSIFTRFSLVASPDGEPIQVH